MLNYIPPDIPSPAAADLDELARMLKVLADPRRLAILDLLMQGVQCNCELGSALGMPANLISHHLRVLRKAGLVEVERDAHDSRWLYYSLNREALERLNQQFRDFFDPQRIQERSPACGPRARKQTCTPESS
ncbi:MAG: ArsR family transcriptional regulator [Chloroflexi bacterium]|nr:MAG: ArsR family transcriptional regulator [Chloroflexota bacterium]